jgi:hypothetical protein
MVLARGRWALAAIAAALAPAAAGCGGQSQDAGEPSGHFKVRVTRASFPQRQALSEEATLRIEVANADHRTLPDAAVTVETRPAAGLHGAAPEAFGVADKGDSELADDARPVWIVDHEPHGGQSVYTNTWAAGPMSPGETRSFEWRLLPVKPGRYTVSWAVSPGLNGKARAARGERTRGSFAVRISARPVAAGIDDKGNVVRGAAAGQ